MACYRDLTELLNKARLEHPRQPCGKILSLVSRERQDFSPGFPRMRLERLHFVCADFFDSTTNNEVLILHPVMISDLFDLP